MKTDKDQSNKKINLFHTTPYGQIFNGDSLQFSSDISDESFDLIVTSVMSI